MFRGENCSLFNNKNQRKISDKPSPPSLQLSSLTGSNQTTGAFLLVEEGIRRSGQVDGAIGL